MLTKARAVRYVLPELRGAIARIFQLHAGNKTRIRMELDRLVRDRGFYTENVGEPGRDTGVVLFTLQYRKSGKGREPDAHFLVDGAFLKGEVRFGSEPEGGYIELLGQKRPPPGTWGTQRPGKVVQFRTA